ncbi:Stp1/IreP family PP2C-type Ser/Thr phosphatase [uncultured Clostridium sp.]|uniref:Stp1/IreP family PP2C-type Ser/Thr phosphatase n=1 Tax=uncultured Clostridium sp. TaxID=59620 RepID=UPI00261F3BA8|nr:Stp1/IreP family PP2C-type Ser/Thr phosphatase [uncultured Clostridium sp.]
MIEYKSDVGCTRSLNEDYCDFFEVENYGLYIVADGMGGHNAGEIASKMAVTRVIEIVRETIDVHLKDSLKIAIEKTNEEIYNYSKENNELSGMGTTITAILRVGNDIIIANVGDSSCFGLKDGKITKLTKDHSLVQQLVDMGSISYEQAKNHPNRNIITRALGTELDLKVDIFEFNIEDFDKYLLCTDGLTNEVNIEKIKEIISEEKEDSCHKLVEKAKENGGKDNITVMLFGGDI